MMVVFHFLHISISLVEQVRLALVSRRVLSEQHTVTYNYMPSVSFPASKKPGEVATLCNIRRDKLADLIIR